MGNKSGYLKAKELAVEAALEAYKIYKREEKGKSKKDRLRNMGLLMDHYIDFLDCYNNIKSSASEICNELSTEELSSLDQDDVIIMSIKRSKIRTKIMISQIEVTVDMIKKQYEQRNEPEKLTAFMLMYLERKNIDYKFSKRLQVVAEQMESMGRPCSESSVRRWCNEILSEMAAKLFGIDGLRLDI